MILTLEAQLYFGEISVLEPQRVMLLTQIYNPQIGAYTVLFFLKSMLVSSSTIAARRQIVKEKISLHVPVARHVEIIKFLSVSRKAGSFQ